jgi:hypothetical protein
VAPLALRAMFSDRSNQAFSTLLINIFMVTCGIDFYMECLSIETKYNISFGICQG